MRFVFHRPHAVGNALIQFQQKRPIVVVGLFGAREPPPPAPSGWWRRKRSRATGGPLIFPGPLSTGPRFPGIAPPPGEAVPGPVLAGHAFQSGEHGFHLGNLILDMVGPNLSDAALGNDPHHRNIELPAVKVEPVLDIPALAGVVDQNVGAGRGPPGQRPGSAAWIF